MPREKSPYLAFKAEGCTYTVSVSHPVEVNVECAAEEIGVIIQRSDGQPLVVRQQGRNLIWLNWGICPVYAITGKGSLGAVFDGDRFSEAKRLFCMRPIVTHQIAHICWPCQAW